MTVAIKIFIPQFWMKQCTLQPSDNSNMKSFTILMMESKMSYLLTEHFDHSA